MSHFEVPLPLAHGGLMDFIREQGADWRAFAALG
jgi:hypothetical protein